MKLRNSLKLVLLATLVAGCGSSKTSNNNDNTSKKNPTNNSSTISVKIEPKEELKKKTQDAINKVIDLTELDQNGIKFETISSIKGSVKENDNTIVTESSSSNTLYYNNDAKRIREIMANLPEVLDDEALANLDLKSNGSYYREEKNKGTYKYNDEIDDYFNDYYVEFDFKEGNGYNSYTYPETYSTYDNGEIVDTYTKIVTEKTQFNIFEDDKLAALYTYEEYYQIEQIFQLFKGKTLEEIKDTLIEMIVGSNSEEEDSTIIALIIDNTFKLFNNELSVEEYVDTVLGTIIGETDYSEFKKSAYYTAIVNSLKVVVDAKDSFFKLKLENNEFNFSFDLATLCNTINTICNTILNSLKNESEESTLTIRNAIATVKLINDNVLKYVKNEVKFSLNVNEHNVEVTSAAKLDINLETVPSELNEFLFDSGDSYVYSNMNISLALQINLLVQDSFINYTSLAR